MRFSPISVASIVLPNLLLTRGLPVDPKLDDAASLTIHSNGDSYDTSVSVVSQRSSDGSSLEERGPMLPLPPRPRKGYFYAKSLKMGKGFTQSGLDVAATCRSDLAKVSCVRLPIHNR